jgi:EAL domain-containing protein (putative c-di-GMP-specific phosphodiesterase class I)
MGLAADMGKQLIVEGVETNAQGEKLLAMGCELAQGYAIAKPMPASKVIDWLRDWEPAF